MTVNLPEVDDRTSVDDLTSLDFDPPCEMPACEAGSPAARWIFRSKLGCGHDGMLLCCEPCRLRGVQLALEAIAHGMVAICRVCMFPKQLVVVEDAFTFEPLRGGQ